MGAEAALCEKQLEAHCRHDFGEISKTLQRGNLAHNRIMVDAEWNRRQQNRLARCIREAHFANPAAMIEDIEYHEDRRLDKSQILRFATCKYIEDGHHIILKGASGSGKTFWPVPSKTRPAANTSLCAISVFRSCWRS